MKVCTIHRGGMACRIRAGLRARVRLRDGVLPAALLIAASGLTAPAHAQYADYVPLPVGTQFTVSVAEPGYGIETFESEVIATGPDFMISREVDPATHDDPASYYVEFSGFFLLGCEEALPSEEQRAQLRALWPLREGGMAEISGPFSGRVSVGARTSAQLPGGERGEAHAVVVGYDYEDEPFQESIMLADGLPTPTLVIAGTGSITSLATLNLPENPVELSPVDNSVLQNCASLF